MRLFFKARINDWILWTTLLYLVIADILLLVSLLSSFVVLLYGIPLILLNVFLFPVLRVLFHQDVSLYDLGIKIRGNFLRWEKIRSISFSSGRYRDSKFWSGLKLPAVQRLYLLDMDGKEYIGVIDIDHSLKSSRSRNNMLRMNEQLHILNKSHLISDWAEKR
ncbi:MAG: hypothetical protein NDI94_00230 [Candidatus Woesearchaeota archaeon]|nr:hypothetical protein [Candidatus Woesearchaeota archaeon]